jgi:ABC-type nitrate/sulfonate/bicarbonate transport system substrate-binding protein
MNKKIFILIILVLIIIIGAFLIFYQKKEVDLKIGYNVDSVNHATSIIMLEKKMLEARGLTVEYIPVTSTKYSLQALAIGQLDITSGGVSHFFSPISKEVPIKLISPLITAPTLVYVRENDIKKISDLNGKKINVKLGSVGDFSLRYIFKKEGFDLNYITENISNEFELIALVDKKIVDVILGGTNNQKAHLLAGAVILEEWIEKGYSEIYFPRTTLAVNTNFLNTNPEKVDLFIDALIESHKFIHDNPDEAYTLIANHLNKHSSKAIVYTSQDIEELFMDLKLFLWFDPIIFEEMALFSKDMGDIDKELSVNDLFDLRYSERLQKAQEEIYGKQD